MASFPFLLVCSGLTIVHARDYMNNSYLLGHQLLCIFVIFNSFAILPLKEKLTVYALCKSESGIHV